MWFPKIFRMGKTGGVIAGLSIVVLIQAGLMWAMQAEAREPKANSQKAEKPGDNSDQQAAKPDRAADPFDDFFSTALSADPFFADNGDPFEHMRQMQARMDRLFARTWQDFGGLDARAGAPSLRAGASDLKLEEQSDRYVVKAELPGVDESNLKVDIKDGRLTIRGQRQLRSEKTGPKGAPTARQLQTESFEQSISLPDDVDTEKVEVKFEDGVLRAILPKTQAR